MDRILFFMAIVLMFAACDQAKVVDLTPVWADDDSELAVVLTEWEPDCVWTGDCSGNRLNEHFRIVRFTLEGDYVNWSEKFSGYVYSQNFFYMKTQGYVLFKQLSRQNGSREYRFIKLDAVGNVSEIPKPEEHGRINRAVIPSPNGEVLAIIQQSAAVENEQENDYVSFLASSDLQFISEHKLPTFSWYTWTPNNVLVVTKAKHDFDPCCGYPGPDVAALSMQASLDGSIAEIESPSCQTPPTNSSNISADHVRARGDQYYTTSRDFDSDGPKKIQFESAPEEDIFGCQYSKEIPQLGT